MSLSLTLQPQFYRNPNVKIIDKHLPPLLVEDTLFSRLLRRKWVTNEDKCKYNVGDYTVTLTQEHSNIIYNGTAFKKFMTHVRDKWVIKYLSLKIRHQTKKSSTIRFSSQ